MARAHEKMLLPSHIFWPNAMDADIYGVKFALWIDQHAPLRNDLPILYINRTNLAD